MVRAWSIILLIFLVAACLVKKADLVLDGTKRYERRLESLTADVGINPAGIIRTVFAARREPNTKNMMLRSLKYG